MTQDFDYADHVERLLNKRIPKTEYRQALVDIHANRQCHIDGSYPVVVRDKHGEFLLGAIPGLLQLDDQVNFAVPILAPV